MFSDELSIFLWILDSEVVALCIFKEMRAHEIGGSCLSRCAGGKVENNRS